MIKLALTSELLVSIVTFLLVDETRLGNVVNYNSDLIKRNPKLENVNTMQIVDAHGKRVTITFNKDRTLSFSSNSGSDIKQLALGMSKTNIGLEILQLVHASKTEVSFEIDKMTVKTNSEGNNIAAETYPIISTVVDKYGKAVGPRTILKAKIVIYEAAIRDIAAKNNGNISINTRVIRTMQFSIPDIVASFSIHECTHIIDKKFSGSLNPKATKADLERKPYENQMRYFKELEEQRKVK
jgi:hypothetical protein